jgi:hypothetical protein
MPKRLAVARFFHSEWKPRSDNELCHEAIIHGLAFSPKEAPSYNSIPRKTETACSCMPTGQGSADGFPDRLKEGEVSG